MRANEQQQNEQARVDFFVSSTSKGRDRAWAEWIAWQLEDAGYRVLIQEWDFRPGSNVVKAMDEAARCAQRTLLVLSAAYLASDDTLAQWAVAFRHDPTGAHGRVLPVRIERCEIEGLLGSIAFIDLVDKDDVSAASSESGSAEMYYSRTSSSQLFKVNGSTCLQLASSSLLRYHVS